MTDDNPQPTTLGSSSIPRPSDNLTAEQLIKEHGSKSKAIRALHAQGYPVVEIAKKLGIIYQHARNVILRPLKRNNNHSNQGSK